MAILSDPRRPLLWDLDGTIVDTSRDITTAVNAMLAERRLPTLTVASVLQKVGYGVRHLVRQVLAEALVPSPGAAAGEEAMMDEPMLDEAVASFRRHYADHLVDTTGCYPGMDQLLRDLATSGRRMAVVSNKPQDHTRAILERLGLSSCFVAALGGDSLPRRKPDPEPLWHALMLCVSERPGEAIPSPNAVVIGDSLVDVLASRAAGLPVAVVAWGFEAPERLRQAEPEWCFDTPRELREALLG